MRCFGCHNLIYLSGTISPPEYMQEKCQCREVHWLSVRPIVTVIYLVLASAVFWSAWMMRSLKAWLLGRTSARRVLSVFYTHLKIVSGLLSTALRRRI